MVVLLVEVKIMEVGFEKEDNDRKKTGSEDAVMWVLRLFLKMSQYLQYTRSIGCRIYL
jgi:hypothetical protein